MSSKRTMQRSDLRVYQRRAVKFLKDHEQSALFVDMGLGKTVSTLTALADLFNRGEIERVLVIAPLRVCQGVWQQEAKKWEHLRHLTFADLTGNEEQRLRAHRSDKMIHLINVENLRWLLFVMRHATRGGRAPWPYDTLIIDESSMFKTANTRRFKSIRTAVYKFPRRHILTGTPAPNGVEDVWSQIYILDRGERLRPRVGEFRSKFMDKGGFRGLKYFPREDTSKRVAAAISDIVLTLRAEDWLDLPPLIKQEVWVDLPANVRRLYEKLEAEMFLEFDTGNVVAKHAAVVTSKCHQIANGAVFLSEGSDVWKKLHDAKLEALEQVIDETGCPMLVCYYFQHDLERLRRKWKKAPVLGEARNARELGRMQDEWNAGKHPVMFVHPQGTGHGLNLQDGGYAMTFFSLLFGHEPYRQVIERIGPARQVGKARSVLVKHILTRDTVDVALLMAQQRKFDDERGFVAAVKDYRETKMLLR